MLTVVWVRTPSSIYYENALDVGEGVGSRPSSFFGLMLGAVGITRRDDNEESAHHLTAFVGASAVGEVRATVAKRSEMVCCTLWCCVCWGLLCC